jgi:hypothetical protein
VTLHPAAIDKVIQKTDAEIDEEIAYLAKRHRISPAIVREIVRRTGATERRAIEHEIAKGKARR